MFVDPVSIAVMNKAIPQISILQASLLIHLDIGHNYTMDEYSHWSSDPAGLLYSYSSYCNNIINLTNMEL